MLSVKSATVSLWCFTVLRGLLCIADKECKEQGVEYVPVSLRQKRRPRDGDEGENERQKNHKKKGDREMWEPSSSEGEHSDSEDSMSDLYPCE